jgi:hypothetical protein
MENNVKDIKKSDSTPTASSKGGLMSFDDFDNYFDDFLSRRWPRLIDWNFPSTSIEAMEKGFPKVDTSTMIMNWKSRLPCQASGRKTWMSASTIRPSPSAPPPRKRKRKKANTFAAKLPGANTSGRCPCLIMSTPTMPKPHSRTGS